jgi:hypothetical protein
MLDTQVNNNELLFYIQEDDPQKDDYIKMFKEMNHTGYIVEPWQPTSYLWNRLSDIAKGELLCLMGDDVVFETKGWDKRIEEEASKYSDGIYVITTLDGRKEDDKNLGCPHPVVNKKWKETLGFFLPPQFMHRYLDTYTKRLAQSIDRYIQIWDVRFRHQKSLTSKDPTGTKSREWLTYDKYSYEHTKRWFEADLELLKRTIKK